MSIIARKSQNNPKMIEAIKFALAKVRIVFTLFLKFIINYTFGVI